MEHTITLTLRYAHAVKNPWDNSIPKPFEFREIHAVLSLEREKPGMDDDWIASIHDAGGALLGRTSHPDQREAAGLAQEEAEYWLMDNSRAPWPAPHR